MKTCTKCGTEYPATTDHFHQNGSGLHPNCKRCRSKRAADRYKADPETHRTRNRAWQAANPEKVAEQSRRWAKENPERARERDRNWRRAHPDKNAAITQRWREKHREQYNAYERENYARTRERHIERAAKLRAENRDRYNAYQAKRRALTLAGGSFTAEDILRLHATQDGRCRWCSEPLGNRYHVDHVIPVSRGGSNEPDNLALACPPCNHRKSSSIPFVEWQPPNPLHHD